jgi:hypothetical protein
MPIRPGARQCAAIRAAGARHPTRYSISEPIPHPPGRELYGAPKNSGEVALVGETELGGHVPKPLPIGDLVDCRRHPDIVAVLDQCRACQSAEDPADVEGRMTQASRESRQIEASRIRRDRPSHVIHDPLIRSCGCRPSRGEGHAEPIDRHDRHRSAPSVSPNLPSRQSSRRKRT